MNTGCLADVHYLPVAVQDFRDDDQHEDKGSPSEKNQAAYLGIAQIAVDPPPALKRALWGTFSGLFLKGCMVLIVKKVPKTIRARV